jgi:hypothetical protein
LFWPVERECGPKLRQRDGVGVDLCGRIDEFAVHLLAGHGAGIIENKALPTGFVGSQWWYRFAGTSYVMFKINTWAILTRPTSAPSVAVMDANCRPAATTPKPGWAKQKRNAIRVTGCHGRGIETAVTIVDNYTSDIDVRFRY